MQFFKEFDFEVGDIDYVAKGNLFVRFQYGRETKVYSLPEGTEIFSNNAFSIHMEWTWSNVFVIEDSMMKVRGTPQRRVFDDPVTMCFYLIEEPVADVELEGAGDLKERIFVERISCDSGTIDRYHFPHYAEINPGDGHSRIVHDCMLVVSTEGSVRIVPLSERGVLPTTQLQGLTPKNFFPA